MLNKHIVQVAGALEVGIGFCGRAAEDACDIIRSVDLKGGEQAAAGTVGRAGFETYGFLYVIRRVGEQKGIGISPGADFAFAVVGVAGSVFGGSADLGNLLRIQAKLAYGHHVRHGGIVIGIVIAVGIRKVRAGHAHKLRLPVHFIYKGGHGIFLGKVGVL